MSILEEGGKAYKPSKTQREAWQRFPDANSADAACLADRLISDAHKRWESSALSRLFSGQSGMDQIRIDIASKTWDSLSQDDKKEIPNSAKTYLASRIPGTQAGDAIQAKIIGGETYADFGFTSWELERQRVMYLAMGADPLIADAKKRWDDPSFTVEDKLKLAQRIQDIQAKSFDATPVPVITYSKPITKGILENGNNEGSLKDGTARIEINTYPSTTLHRDFDDFVETVAHEGTHALQNQIAEHYLVVKDIQTNILKTIGEQSISNLSDKGLADFNTERDRQLKLALPNGSSNWSKELAEGGRLASVAPLFNYNLGKGYMGSDDIAGLASYRANPVEEHARDVGFRVANYLGSDDAKRKETLDTNSFFSEIHKEAAEKIAASRARTMKSEALCP